MATFSYMCVCDISEKNVVLLFIFGTVMMYHVELMHVHVK